MKKTTQPFALSFVLMVFILAGLICCTNKALVRVALDVGSGGLKATVAEIDPLTHTIRTVHYADEFVVLFKHDMEMSGLSHFSPAIQEHALQTLHALKQELSLHEPVEWSGIATAASRQAQNAHELYAKIRDELGISIKIISQEEEGRLGFLTAMAASGVPKEHLIVYDSGSGSFQLTTEIDGKLIMLGGQVAYIHALATLVKEIRKQELGFGSPNPIAVSEAKQLVELLKQQLPEVPALFAEKFKHHRARVVGIGNKYYIFALAAQAIGKNIYTKQELWQAIEAHCHLEDHHPELSKFPRPHEAVLGMLLLYSVMDGLGIDELLYASANGSCEGLLVDRSYWLINQAPDVPETMVLCSQVTTSAPEEQSNL